MSYHSKNKNNNVDINIPLLEICSMIVYIFGEKLKFSNIFRQKKTLLLKMLLIQYSEKKKGKWSQKHDTNSIYTIPGI